MTITAVVDRIENGSAILLSEEFDAEIRIPAGTIEGMCGKGEKVYLTLDEDIY